MTKQNQFQMCCQHVIPNLLVNGSSGIAVGMATNIPPHNLAEVVKGCLAIIENSDITIDELMEYIPGPDFPTGPLSMVKLELFRPIAPEEAEFISALVLILKSMKRLNVKLLLSLKFLIS